MRNVLSGITLAILVSLSGSAFAAAADYRFELAGAPQASGGGISVVSVKLVHIPDNKPVTGAVFVEETADMGPEGMAGMGAPVTPLAEQSGIYRFQVKNGPVWDKPDNWALTLTAKVPGEQQPVHGSLNVRLEP